MYMETKVHPQKTDKNYQQQKHLVSPVKYDSSDFRRFQNRWLKLTKAWQLYETVFLSYFNIWSHKTLTAINYSHFTNSCTFLFTVACTKSSISPLRTTW
jgi:hypothetical protein